MNSKSKQQEQYCEKEKFGEDRISSLADEVICHILSFLPTKYAVGTSVLSKRWKYVWTCVPNLDFNDSLLFHQGRLSEDEAQSCFITFVNKVLSLHNLPCFRKFHLDCSKDYDQTLANAWICPAITPNVEELDLGIGTVIMSLELPQTLYYTCENLLHLKISFFNLVLNVSTSVCLPRLKTLRLSRVYFVDNDSLKKLLSGCPVLQDLCIEREEWDGALSLYVCSSSLKRLTIDNGIEEWDGTCIYTLVVEAPNLEHLVLRDYTTENYKMNDLPSLVSANIEVMAFDIESSPVVQLLKDVSNVKELRLSSSTVDDLRDTSYDSLPVFHNLTHLKVEIFKKDRSIVPYLLERSPNLKSLFFEKANVVVGGCAGWHPQDCVSECLLMHLETIEIEVLEGLEEDMEMIGFFLKNAMVLKMMTVYSVNLDSEMKSEILKKLLMFPKGSGTCQIALH